MARVIHSINVTVGGTCDHADTVADEEHHRYAVDLVTSSSALLLGRNTFDLFESFWPQAVNSRDLPAYMKSLAAELDAKPKYVVSSRSLDTDWKNTRLLRGPDLREVEDLIGSIAGTVVVFGSPGLGTSLAAAGLVDELHLLVEPFIGAAGKRAFDGLDTRKDLAFLDARPFRSGAVLLRYARDAASRRVTVDLLKGFLDAFNRHDLDAIMDYFADDCVFYMPRGAGPRGDRYIGKDAVRAGLAKRFEGIPNVHYGEDRHWVCGDFGVSEWTLTGTSVSGESLEVRGIDLLEFVDGKIRRKDSFWKIVSAPV